MVDLAKVAFVQESAEAFQEAMLEAFLPEAARLVARLEAMLEELPEPLDFLEVTEDSAAEYSVDLES